MASTTRWLAPVGKFACIFSRVRARPGRYLGSFERPGQNVTISNDRIGERATELERWLLREHGPVLKGAPLRKLLGYPTPDAFRQGLRRHGAPVPLVAVPGKKAWCAATRDVAHWMARTEAELLTSDASRSPNTPEKPMT